MHDPTDLDSSVFAGHHSLGPRAHQAAPGNHQHAPFKDFVPVVTPDTGAFTTVSSVMRYNLFEDLLTWICRILITTPGTAGGKVNFTLPYDASTVTATAGGFVSLGTGSELGVNGKALQVWRSAPSKATVAFYDFTNPIGASYLLVMSGAYEVVIP
jgi:hypothetical protein